MNNRLKHLLLISISLACLGFTAASFALSCQSYAQENANITGDNHAFIGDCIKTNYCASATPNSPAAISHCAAWLKVNAYKSNYQYYYNQYQKQNNHNQAFDLSKLFTFNHPNTNQNANSVHTNQANQATPQKDEIAPIIPTNHTNKHKSNNDNTIHWF